MKKEYKLPSIKNSFDLLNNTEQNKPEKPQVKAEPKIEPQNTPVTEGGDFELEESEKKLYKIPIELIKPNPKNSRKRQSDKHIQKLVQSIKSVGLRGTFEVIDNHDNTFNLFYGSSRLKAAKIAGEEYFHCEIKEEADLKTSIFSFLENFSREGISKMEEAYELEELKQSFPKDINNKKLAEITGLSTSDISRVFKLLELPQEVQDYMLDQDISYSQAKYLIPLIGNNEDLLSEAAKMIVTKKLTVKELERFIEKRLNPSKSNKNSTVDENYAKYQDNITKSLKVNVQIRPSKNKGGKIVLNYTNEEQLNKLIERLTDESREQ